MNASTLNPPCPPATSSDMGIVVIGRNEGQRLERCLCSLDRDAGLVVYVDSGSLDQSIVLARQKGAEVVELDPCASFTAAKARNVGLQRLLEIQPKTQFVQFVDGDCEVAPGWMNAARQLLSQRNNVAVVCGRRRERSPDASIYNRLCDMEWDAPTGEVMACGGDAMMRVAPFVAAGGFRSSMIAGEEPELCVRLRARQWRIVRISAEMTLHDAAIFRFSQWWRRSVRAGHAVAEATWLHHGSHSLRRAASLAFWAALLPMTAIAMAWLSHGVSLTILLFAYAVLGLRIYVGQLRRGRPSRGARLYAVFVVIGKVAELFGMIRFAIGKLLRRRTRIIEYKTPQWLSPQVPDSP